VIRRTSKSRAHSRRTPKNPSSRASLVFAFLEPDPTVEWDKERVEHLRRTLFSGDVPQL
jgi:hypothetical protein